MLPKLIAKACMPTIPRSGTEGDKVNCFRVALDRNESPFFVAKEYAEHTLLGLEWDGSSYTKELCLELSELDIGKLNVTHYYGLSEIRYDNIYDIVLQHITKFIYFKIRLYRFINVTYKYFFNKKKLVTKKRMELIQFMMNDQLDRVHEGITSIDLMTKLYSISWILHPSGDEQHKKLELYLDSLIRSEDLQKVNDEYIVTGKAISTIEKYEEDERRHTEAVKLQRKIVVLNIFLLLVAIVQADVLKLPTLIDFSNNNSIKSNNSIKH